MEALRAHIILFITEYYFMIGSLSSNVKTIVLKQQYDKSLYIYK